jgi:hypothetical protein
MSEYIFITEAALDFCLTNSSFNQDFLPYTGDDIRTESLSSDIVGYFAANEPDSPYFALIRIECLSEIKKISDQPDDAYRRIARVVKGLKSPPIHLPRQWSEYHHRNLLAFFALPKGASTRRWVADLNGSLKGVRFDVLAAASAEVDLIKHSPRPWPDSIQNAIASLATHRFQFSQADAASALTAEVDLKAIGSASVANNRTYEEWEPHLTESQREVLKHSIDSSIRIIGPAGSGKTLALCMRAIQISRDPDVGAKGKRILIATHSWAMAERIDGVLRVLNGGASAAGITTFPLLSLLELHAGHIGQQRTDVIGDDSSDGRSKSLEIIKSILASSDKKSRTGISEWIANGLQAADESRSRLELVINLYDEIAGVLTASGVSPDDPDSIRQYINGEREDWMPPFSTVVDRGFVVAIYREFIQNLIDRSSITTDQFVLDSIRVLETFTWRMRKETDGYDYIMVDELQLFDPQERSALELLGRSKKGVPFITAEDPSQGIFAALNARPGIYQNELVYLDTVHRFNREIFELISYIYQKFPLNTLPLKIDASKSAKKQLPCLYTAENDVNAIKLAADLAENINNSATPSDRICIATLGDVDIELADALNARKLLVTRLASFDDVEQLAYSKRSIIVAPWQFIGGTQFSHVIVVAAAIAAPQSQFGKLRELISVYLSCSRAAHSLNIVTNCYVPAVIWEAKDHGLLTHIPSHS